MPIISAFPTGESTVDYTGPKSGLPSLEEGKVAYATDEKRLYTGNADGTNTQVPNADDVKTEVSDAVNSHNSATDAHASQFAKYLPLSGGEMTNTIKAPAQNPVLVSTNGAVKNNNGSVLAMVDNVTMLEVGKAESKVRTQVAVATSAISIQTTNSDNSCLVYIRPTGVSLEGTSGITDDKHITTKKYVDDTVGSAITSAAPSACKVTLSASGWDSSAKTQSATVSGVLEDESKQLIMPMPAGTSMSAYNKAGIQMTAQAANKVTFTADTVPTADVEVWVVVQSVNDVTPPPPLDQASWDYISKQSLAGNAKNIWAVGDCKKIKLSGTAGTLRLNTELYVYILDFDHDSSTVGGAKDGITFGTFKTALTDGVDVALYNSSGFSMNTSNTNSGGWKNSNMRYTILGSTNTQNGDAAASTATSPKANTLMSCLPADLRAVMRPMCIYTDNTGGDSGTAACVTTTIDFLPLLAEFEIYGARTGANSAEKNNQTQYAYFKNGNSKVKYRHDSQSSTVTWWSRSPFAYYSELWCCVSSNGSSIGDGAYNSRAVAPMFKI